MEYDFRKIEPHWQKEWKKTGAYKVSNDSARQKFYVLDMFPYPSGSGLHVGHPLGYIASDIYSRYKRLKGFNVLHPMGFDSFGLPAEQYAIETGQHPAETTKKNIATFKNQLDKIGFSYDWDREVQTSDPQFYKWTQWIFLQLFNSYFDNKENKAKPIAGLIYAFENYGSYELKTMNLPAGQVNHKPFTADEWKKFNEEIRQDILMQYRLAFSAYGEVNWCEALGTVLANDEVVNGVSERGGHPVEKRKMRQWFLRITAYADRLLEGLEKVDFSESMKEMQKNWIGRSEGAEIDFNIKDQRSKIRVYTTRPDTIFGADFMVVAPEHEIVTQITSAEQKGAIDDYLAYVKNRSERERLAEVKQITGCFTGTYAVNPFDNREIPVWIAEYVLVGYGTGAIMAVPCGDQRDFLFARHFNIPITNIIGKLYNGEEANPTKDAILENSGFLNGLLMKDAITVAISKIEELGIGKKKVNYRMRDAGFSRQRYWGEPFPIVWSDGIAIPLDADELPLELPHVEKYGPGKEGEGPLSNLADWVNVRKNMPEGVFLGRRETSTMPGYAGSSWYFLRYMDPHNNKTFCDRKVSDYWNQVDLYIGGTEHAVGHLLYSRMWTKVLFDLGLIGFDEPYKKLLNQGMITGFSEKIIRASKEDIEDQNSKVTISSSSFLINWASKNGVPFILDLSDDNSRLNINDSNIKTYIWNLSEDLSDYPDRKAAINVPIEFVDDGVLQIQKYMEDKATTFQYYDKSTPEVFLCRDGYYNTETNLWYDYDKNLISPLVFRTVRVPEKMSKSKRNVVNPDELCDKYGADTFRMYEMFLGPVEASKPWDTKGIEGVHRFLRKLWRLFFDDIKGKVWNSDKPTDAELKVLHRTIKKIEEDTERFSFNTAVSTFMICVNELSDLKCHKKEVLEKVLILLTPYAPHIAEELWHELGNEGTILDAEYPTYNPALLVESAKDYPVSVNGKLRTNITLALDLEQKQVEEIVLQNEIVQKWLEGKAPKKIIFVKNKMINVVI